MSGAGAGFGGGSGAGGGIGTGVTGGGITIGGLGGVLLQAASASRTIPSETGKLRRVYDMGTGMWLLMIEAGVALFLLVFIVWWTMYSGQKPTAHEADQPAAPEASDKSETPKG
jgi:hypothetical protein